MGWLWHRGTKATYNLRAEEEKRLHRCAFTGHRPEKLDANETEIKIALREVIIKAIDDGYNVFITGMARGVDLWAAEIILDLRRRNSALKLMCAVPYEGFESRWSREWQTLYRSIIIHADYVKIIGSGYSTDIFQRRNKWMVNHATRLIAVYNGDPGGTRNTIEYASTREIEIEFVKMK